ncbi:MAG TPA: phosphate/phosphite/phosphonate ABC transporter substrate-binding protein [Candidatus Thiothrix moscowensis]|uniref:phosphate/phosphite/phosphonate ABC transporter substrate-binding protein n=1 Tax=unclassified Thiothrix TaxID=2636184 RepID=UPI0025DD379D|nr:MULTISPECIES: phosphate/phosphite/phosphonate ABC transporter substrate-binding protein [unclassified Thiothrix]HRJ52726.1 phosphate/phosphite/phosphonate ABC transporter substrate-binding protein [Candidatus Thiothrix moscowensis]HRJ92790.1 phosphate/phosphite/phosphonate ABC transporter substrate-binding protein [Candidatus Thiothrix moscowensis]
MRYVMTVSPDFPPTKIAGWYIFNTWLQRQLGEHIHLELYQDFASQRDAIRADNIDLIYANPFDAAMLVRERGFVAIATPINISDEAIIAVSADSSIHEVEQLQPGTRIATTDDPDVNLISMIMLEPANLSARNVETQTVDTYVLVAKQLLQGKADVGFFLRDAFQGLSRMIREQLRPLVRSEIHVIRHVLLAGPRLQARHDDLRQLLPAMTADTKSNSVLVSLGLQGWELQGQEDTEFMIDLMDTLVD